jgi:formate dehydrogenase maturation protein FdhE|tara:strand:+ start:143 stop:532 length:390 start_codon:yes stop_codon:yes gene_type:complete
MHAQGPGRERIKSLKVAFITERVGLTSEEAQQFWPIYNEHEETLENMRRKERMELHANISRVQELSTNESEKLLDNLLTLQFEKQKAERDFLSKLRTVIPAKKVLLLVKAEEDFKRQMIQQFRKRRGRG